MTEQSNKVKYFRSFKVLTPWLTFVLKSIKQDVNRQEVSFKLNSGADLSATPEVIFNQMGSPLALVTPDKKLYGPSLGQYSTVKVSSMLYYDMSRNAVQNIYTWQRDWRGHYSEEMHANDLKWLLGSKLSKERPPVKSIKKGVLSYSRDWVASKENTK